MMMARGDDGEKGNANAPGLDWKPGRAEYFLLFSLAILILMVAIDATIVVPVLPTIASELHGSTTDIFWAGSSYLLSCAIVQPVIVSLSNDFGRRSLVYLSITLFTTGTLICCLSHNFPVLLAGRTVQGVGGGGIVSLNYVILSDVVPLRQRPTYLAITQLSYAVGSTIGPLIGGLFAQHTTWRWVFYMNFPFCGLGLVMIPFSVKLHVEAPSLRTRLLRFDWLGTAAFTCSITSFLVGITLGGSEFPWSSWNILVPIVLGLLGLAATGWWEARGAKRPLIRPSLFNSRCSIAAYACVFLQGLLLFCNLYYIPVYFEGAKSYSPTMTGVALIPVMMSLLGTSIVTGLSIQNTGHYRWAIWAGWAIVTLASGLMIMWGVDTRAFAWVLMFLVLGLGHGLVFMSLNICTQALVDEKDSSHAAGMYSFIRSFGMCVGVSVGATVFQNTLRSHLDSHGLPPDLATNIVGLFALLHGSSAPRVFRIVISQSFQNLAQLMTGVGALGGLLSIVIQSRSLDREHNPEHVLQRHDDASRVK